MTTVPSPNRPCRSARRPAPTRPPRPPSPPPAAARPARPGRGLRPGRVHRNGRRRHRRPATAGAANGRRRSNRRRNDRRRNGGDRGPPANRVGLGRLGVGQVLGVRPGHVPGPHRGAGRHLHRGHEAILAGPVSRWTTRHGPGKVEPMPGDEPGRTLWRHRNFLLLWSGQTVSEMGSAVTQLALPLTAVVVLRASTFQVGAAHRGGDSRVRADRPPGRRHRGPARQAAADDLVRRRPDADHRLGPAGRRVRRAHLGSAVRGRHRRRGVHRVLRRVLPELPARPDRHGRPGRRERQARRHAVVRAAGRAGSGRRPGRPGRRGPGHVRGRGLLRGLGGLPAGHPRPRGGTAPGPAPEAADRDRRRAVVRPAAPDPAQDRGLHRDREPVRQHGRRTGDHLPGPAAARPARRAPAC